MQIRFLGAADTVPGSRQLVEARTARRVCRGSWFPGFQVAGSRGAHLVGGASEVKIHGECVAVTAEVRPLRGCSAHADAGAVPDWLRGLQAAPERCFVVRGDPDAADAPRLRIQDELGWRIGMPERGSAHEA